MAAVGGYGAVRETVIAHAFALMAYLDWQVLASSASKCCVGSVRFACKLLTSSLISVSDFPAIRAAFMASTSYDGQPEARRPIFTGFVKSPCFMPV
jgi:hypothetical protein